MNVRKLSLLLMLAGVALLLLSIVWFFVAYASTLDTMSRYGDKDVTMQMMACIYSSPPICQGAAFLSDSPTYSPVVFWLGVILLLAGIIVFFALNKQITSASIWLVALTSPMRAKRYWDLLPKTNTPVMPMCFFWLARQGDYFCHHWRSLL